MTEIWWMIGALVAGIVVGAAVVWMLKREPDSGGRSVKALREENEKFREEVNDHFVETADLINALTDSYKKVFDHLSEGAEKLVDDAVIRERMPQVSDQEIRLKRIGQRVPSDRDLAAEQASESLSAPETPADDGATVSDTDEVPSSEEGTRPDRP